MKTRSLTLATLFALVIGLSGCVMQPSHGYTSYPMNPTSPMIAYQPVYVVPAPVPYYGCPPRTTLRFTYQSGHSGGVWFHGQYMY